MFLTALELFHELLELPAVLGGIPDEFSTMSTLFRMGFFGAAQGWGDGQKSPFPKICHTYPTMMKLGTVIPYLKKFQKLYGSHDTPLGFC